MRFCTDLLSAKKMIYIRNNNFFGRIQRPNGTVGFIRNTSFPGSPDLIIFLREGRCVHCELKSDRGTQSEEQKTYESMVKAIGHDYRIVRSPDDFISLINELWDTRKNSAITKT